jgi:hypothetical protein
MLEVKPVFPGHACVWDGGGIDIIIIPLLPITGSISCIGIGGGGTNRRRRRERR